MHPPAVPPCAQFSPPTCAMSPSGPPCTPHAIRYGSVPFERARDRPRPATRCPAMHWAQLCCTTAVGPRKSWRALMHASRVVCVLWARDARYVMLQTPLYTVVCVVSCKTRFSLAVSLPSCGSSSSTAPAYEKGTGDHRIFSLRRLRYARAQLDRRPRGLTCHSSYVPEACRHVYP